MSAIKYLTFSPIVLLTACQDPANKAETTPAPIPPQPAAQVIVAETPASIPPASVGLKKANFPIYLEGVPSLLHPIVPSVPLDGKDAKLDYTSKSRTDDASVSYFQQTSPYQFQSTVYNLVFEDIKTGTTKRLFPHDNFIIKSTVYPFVEAVDKTATKPKQTTDTATTPDTPTDTNNPADPLGKPTKKMLHHFVYQVKERPSDDDSKTNIDEQLALYMSDDAGNNLVKLHPNNQYVKTTQWLPEVERYYFTTQADTNGDNLIDANDKYFNYVIDFANPIKKLDDKGKALSEQPKVMTYSFLK